MSAQTMCSLCYETVPDLHDTRAGQACFGCADGTATCPACRRPPAAVLELVREVAR